MHFSIPDTEELKDLNGSPYSVFNIHINGVFHCSVRYKQLHNFHEQLKAEFPMSVPQFPPKKWLSLTPAQLEQRRFAIERYIQIVSQDPQICNSEIFNSFLLNAQQETQQQEAEEVVLEVYLMNGHRITVKISSTDQTDQVLEAVAEEIQLPDEFVYYFGLFLVEKDKSGDSNIIRKLQDFESPFISLRSASKNSVHKIVLRKSYWDSSYDDDLLDDRVAMNLLYVQTVSDVDRGWILASKEQLQQLSNLKHKGSKREYLELARTLKYYGYLVFRPCYTDYPEDGCPVLVAAGNKELNFRVQVGDEVKEGSFKVTRMRCWRLTTTIPEPTEPGQPTRVQLELAFEYLMSRDHLQWIRIVSDEAILMSVSLQRMVDELLLRKQGKRIRKPQDRVKRSTSQHVFLKRDGSSHVIKSMPQSESEPNFTAVKGSDFRSKPRGLPAMARNDAYDLGANGIGDDDL